MKPTCTLYFAYGSNLCHSHMKHRCPAAKAIKGFELHDSVLVFRGVADCDWKEGSICYGGLWRITERCEQSLDLYEGVAGGFYRKEYIPLPTDQNFEASHMMMYVMSSTGVFPPAKHYRDIIAQGYRDFKLPLSALRDAVGYSHDHQSPTNRELDRYNRKGRPDLAPHPDGRPAYPVASHNPRIEVQRENYTRTKNRQQELFEEWWRSPLTDND